LSKVTKNSTTGWGMGVGKGRSQERLKM
jgi:hypothetical protein